jgi:[ribosomal protein S18]-alanine N-acetyltransferase
VSAAFAPRRADGRDLDAIMAIERVAFAVDAWSESAMLADLDSPHNHYLVLEEAGRVVGYAGLRAPAGSRDADIQTIAVSAESRTRGRGRTLLTALLAEASARGVREVFLDVRDDNEVAQTLYRSEGFVEIGRRPRYYQAAGVDAIVMRLDVPGWAASRDEGMRPAEEPDAASGPLLGISPRLGTAADAGACT